MKTSTGLIGPGVSLGHILLSVDWLLPGHQLAILFVGETYEEKGIDKFPPAFPKHDRLFQPSSLKTISS